MPGSGPTFADGATSPTRAKWHAPRSGERSATMESSASGSSRADGQTWSAVATYAKRAFQKTNTRKEKTRTRFFS